MIRVMPDPSHFKTHKEYLDWYRKYRQKNRLKLREYNREYNREWRSVNGYHNEIKWREEHPEAVRASQILRYAIRKGVIKKKPCVVCGSPKSQGHHEEYSKPLEVTWLCAVCHKKHHQKTNLWSILKTLLTR